MHAPVQIVQQAIYRLDDVFLAGDTSIHPAGKTQLTSFT
jgi:hypothetical protein